MMVRVLLLVGAIQAGHHIQPRHETRFLRILIGTPCVRAAHPRRYARVACIDGQIALRAESYARNVPLDGIPSKANEVQFPHASVVWRGTTYVVNRA